MKIGIDIRTACPPVAGKGWYTFYLVRELLKMDTKNEYILYTDAITADAAAFAKAHIKIIQKHPLLWHFAVIKDFVREGGELFFAPTSFLIPAFLPRSIKSVITIHDLVAFLHPHLHQTKATILEQLFFRHALKKTSHVLVPSENTKKDLMRVFHYSEEKIAVTPLAAGEEFDGTVGGEGGIGKVALAGWDKLQLNLKEKYNLPDDFILTVAGLEPRKNVKILLEILPWLEKNYPETKLVIVGGKGWKSDALQKEISKAGPQVAGDRIIAGGRIVASGPIIHIEQCEGSELPLFYNLARVFIYPSLYEGFGLPPLEAMASGCPVICSNTSSLPEVCGEAVLMFDPKDAEGLKKNLEKILADEELRAELIDRGLKQAQKFSWKKTAEKTLEIFTQAEPQRS